MNKLLRILGHKLYFDKVLRKLSFTPKIVKLDNIRCQKNFNYSNYLGFGSKHIEYFPPYQFFKEYLNNPEKAKIDFINFFYDNILKNKALKISKAQGGWKNGPTYKIIESLFYKKNLKINNNSLRKNKELVEQAILKRVNHYFNVFLSIKNKGYNPYLGPIMIEKENGLYYLINGHHRIAMLSVLGYKQVLLFKRTKLKIFLDKYILS
ncbi:MAG: ParB N-terminal domain-containing protein [Promethearchaeota archaeon]